MRGATTLNHHGARLDHSDEHLLVPQPSCTASSLTQKADPSEASGDLHRVAAPHEFPASPTCSWSGRKLGIALVHVGKAGGTSVRRALVAANVSFTRVHISNAYGAVDCRHDLYVVCGEWGCY